MRFTQTGTQWTTGLGKTTVHHSDKRFAKETLLLVRVVMGRESFSLGAGDTEMYKTAMALSLTELQVWWERQTLNRQLQAHQGWKIRITVPVFINIF